MRSGDLVVVVRRIYGLVQRLDTGPRGPEVTLDELQRRLDELWEPLELLRDEMRRDPGLAEPADNHTQ